MQERDVVGPQIAAQPRGGRQPGPLDQGTREGRPLVIDVQQRRHGGERLAARQGRHRALPPQRGQHLAVRRVAVGGPLVLPVPVADGGALPDDRQTGRPEHRVARDQPGQPVVDRRGRRHVGGGEPAHEAHVEDGQGRLHIVLRRVGGVEEGADGLLGQILVVALTEGDQVLPGDLGGEGDGELVPPLPGVDGYEEVVGRVEAAPAQRGVEPGERRGAQFLPEETLVLDAGPGGERRPGAVRGQPEQPDRAPGLGRVGQVVVGAEAEPPVVGDEAGVALGHPGLDVLEAPAGQLGRGEPRFGELVAGAGEGGGDLLQIDGEDLVAETERLPQFDEEVERREGEFTAVAGAGDGGGVHLPVVEGAADGGEAVAGAAVVAEDEVAAVRLLFGGDQALMGELGEGLAEEEALGGLPALGGEVGDAPGETVHGAVTAFAAVVAAVVALVAFAVAASNASRVQKLSSALFSGFRISRSGTNPTAELRVCTAVLRTSGSTTTRRTAGSSKRRATTAVTTARVKPCTGVPAGATRKCIPTSPGSGS